MQTIVNISFLSFLAVYLLLFVVLFIMKKSKINQSKLLFISSIRMSIQLILAGFILTYIIKNPNWIFTTLYVAVMVGFSIFLVLKKNPWLNRRFQWIVGLALGGTGITITIFFTTVIVGANVFSPQYIIPLCGMILGNSLNGITLGLKSLKDGMDGKKDQMDALINFGAIPRLILQPFVNQALETALLPTLNSMAGMGIIFLPGMMTGQILSGVNPMTAILYQISIMIAIVLVVCLTVFLSLSFGRKTLYNSRNQLSF